VFVVPLLPERESFPSFLLVPSRVDGHRVSSPPIFLGATNPVMRPSLFSLHTVFLFFLFKIGRPSRFDRAFLPRRSSSKGRKVFRWVWVAHPRDRVPSSPFSCQVLPRLFWCFYEQQIPFLLSASVPLVLSRLGSPAARRFVHEVRFPFRRSFFFPLTGIIFPWRLVCPHGAVFLPPPRTPVNVFNWSLSNIYLFVAGPERPLFCPWLAFFRGSFFFPFDFCFLSFLSPFLKILAPTPGRDPFR